MAYALLRRREFAWWCTFAASDGLNGLELQWVAGYWASQKTVMIADYGRLVGGQMRLSGSRCAELLPN